MINIQQILEIVKKKSELKKRSASIVEKLCAVDFEKTYAPDHIFESGLIIDDIKDKIQKFKNCSSFIRFHENSGFDEFGELHTDYKIFQKNSCNNFIFCPVCASSKRNQIIKKIKPFLDASLRVDGLKYYMVTLTIQNVGDPGIGYESLRDYWINFLKKGQKRDGDGKRSSGESGKFLGYIFSCEIIPAKSSNELNYKYHVHAHIIVVSEDEIDYQVYDKEKMKLLVEKYGDRKKIPELEKETIEINQRIEIKTTTDGIETTKKIACSKISREWHESTHGNGINIDVIPIFDHYDWKKKRDVSVSDSIYECIKYELKPWEMDAVSLINVFSAVFGKKRVSRGGIFTNRGIEFYTERGIDLDDEKKINIVGECSTEKTNIFYRDEKYQQSKYLDTLDIDDIILEFRKKIAAILNFYKKNVSDLKKQLFKIQNNLYIETKRLIKQNFRVSVSILLKTLFIQKTCLC